ESCAEKLSPMPWIFPAPDGTEIAWLLTPVLSPPVGRDIGLGGVADTGDAPPLTSGTSPAFLPTAVSSSTASLGCAVSAGSGPVLGAMACVAPADCSNASRSLGAA